MKLVAPFVLLSFALLIAVVLDGTAAESDLVIVNRADVFTLDPQRMSYTQDFRMAYGLYEGLVQWDNRTFEVHEAAAAVPTISDDGRTYTFSIHPDRRWSDGAPVTAHDFIYAWRRLILPDTAADYSNLYFVIDGTREFWESRQQMLRDFRADPWGTNDEETLITHARGMHDRLVAIDDAPTHPAELASPPAVGRSMIRRELSRLKMALATAGATADDIEAVLVDMPNTRDWYRLLDERTSRAAEARMMWDQTCRDFDSMVGLRAVDAHTLEVRLREPCAYFLDLVAFAIGSPVYRPCVEGWPDSALARARDHAEGWAGTSAPSFDDCRWVKLNAQTGRLEQLHQWARPEYLICNGPYVVTQWRYKRDMRLERNEHYPNPSRAQADSIVVRAIEDTNTMVLAFESGSVDWLTDVTADYRADMLEERQRYIERHRDALAQLVDVENHPLDVALGMLPPPEDGERRNIHTFPTFGTDFYSFNCRPELADGRPNPFADPRIRRAFACSVDKMPIVRQVTRLNEPVVNVFIPPNSIPGYESPDGIGYDLDRAIDELRDAGYEFDNRNVLVSRSTGEPFPTIDMLYTTNTQRYKWISLELKAQWESRLGVRIKLRPSDTKFFKEDLKQGKFMIARGNWYGDYGDPTTFLELCRSTDGNNDRGYASETFDQMLDDARAILDPQARLDALRDCEAYLFGDQGEMPLLPLCQLLQVYMYEPDRVQGISDHPRLTQYLFQLDAQKDDDA
ncbi:MAG: peptide ABC transporter substrate-binding protein [Planctomycetota bacterium]